MAYDEQLATRIRIHFDHKAKTYIEKKMMGGLCFMVQDKMCVGIVGKELMCRIDPLDSQELLLKKGVRQMDFTGKPMKGYLFVKSEVLDSDSDLQYWLDVCLSFNPKAKSSKKPSVN